MTVLGALALGWVLAAAPVAVAVPPAPSARLATVTPLFEFHSGAWLNLHHVLFELARRERVAKGAPLFGPPEFEVFPAEATLAPADRKIWRAALDHYAKNWAHKDLLQDPDLNRIKAALAKCEDQPTLVSNDVPASLRTVLNQAVGVYRRVAWPEHDAANRKWASDHEAELQKSWMHFLKRLTKAFATAWPEGKTRVDLVVVGNWAGAYTSTHPLHLTVSSRDPRNQGLAGLEILFHEAAHGISDLLQTTLAAAAKKLKAKDPPGLWHAVLFFAVGEIAREAWADYQPYGLAQGVYAHGWEALLPAIREVWPQVLDGKSTLADGCDALIQRLSSPGAAHGPP